MTASDDQGPSDPLAPLVAAARGGDRDAKEQLLLEWLPNLRQFVQRRMSPLLRAREGSDDLLQSSCREVLAAIDGCEFRGSEAFRGWLFTAVLHKLQKRERDVRAGRRDPRRERPIEGTPSAAEPPAAEPTPSQQLAAAERTQRLREAIATLPPDQRQVLELARLADLPRAEIAQRLGRSEASVRSLLTRALKALAERLADGGPSTA
jgi:RNA polymerase sigma-70 factor (ECF subfamily)